MKHLTRQKVESQDPGEMRPALWVILAQRDFFNREEEAKRPSASSGLPGTGNKSQSPASAQDEDSGKSSPALGWYPEKL